MEIVLKSYNPYHQTQLIIILFVELEAIIGKLTLTNGSELTPEVLVQCEYL